jgi:hypothetical protein
MNDTDNPKVLVVVPLPLATERWRPEIMLALLCALGAVPSAGQGCPTA